MPSGDKLVSVLLVFLTLSIVFESAFTTIFHWSWFVKRVGGKGWRTPVKVFLAGLVFWGYNLDVIRDLLQAMGYSATLSLGGQILTALLISGGSEGVYRVFQKLGLRVPEETRVKEINAV
jgi:hypothetical protein